MTLPDSNSNPQEEGITKGHKRKFGSDGYVHYLDCDDGLTEVKIRPKNETKITKQIQIVNLSMDFLPTL